MANSAYSLLKLVKKSAGLYGGGNFKPVAPFPNSIAAKQTEEEELAAEAANNPENQLQQTQKAQQDAVNDFQKAQQQIQELQGQLQQAQMASTQQAQAVQQQADGAIQKAQMDAEYQLQAEKIKNQKDLLAMQEKYMKGMQKQPKDQGGILSNQLKRVTSRVSKLTKSSAIHVEPRGPGAVKPTSTGTPKPPTSAPQTTSPFKHIAPQNRTPEQRQAQAEYFNKQKLKPEYANATRVPDPSLTPAAAISQIGSEIGEYWKDPKSYADANASRLGDNWYSPGRLLGSLGGFTNTINSGFSNIARGNLLEGGRDLLGGYAQGALTYYTLGGLLGGGGLSAGKNVALLAASQVPSASQWEQQQAATVPEPGQQLPQTPTQQGGEGAGGQQPSGGNMTAMQQSAIQLLQQNPVMPKTPLTPQQRGAVQALQGSGVQLDPQLLNYYNDPSAYKSGSYITALNNRGYQIPDKMPYPQMGLEKEHGYGPLGNLIRDILFMSPMAFGVSPLKIGKPDHARIMQAHSYAPPYAPSTESPF